MTASRHVPLLLGLCALLYLPGLGRIPFYTRGEAREALTAREVVETGRWLVPMRPGDRLTRKPPLFYWAAATMAVLLPDPVERALRLPSVLAATAAVVATGLFGGTVGAGVAALLLATGFEWLRAATSARVDMLLAFGMTLTLVGWSWRLCGAGRFADVLAAAGAATAVLAKGPIGVAFPALALGLAALARRDRTLVRLAVPLAAGGAIAACWYVVAYLAHGRAFLDVVLAENLGRFVDTRRAGTGHAIGAGSIGALALVGLFPWTPLLPLAAAPGALRGAVRTLLVAWIVAIVAVVLASAGKREVYLLPIHPAVALLLADGLGVVRSARLERLLRVTTALYAPLLALVAAVVLLLALGVDVVHVLARWLKPEDLLALGAVRDAAHAHAWRCGAAAVLTLALAAAVWRARATGRLGRLVLLLGGTIALWTVTFQTTLHPAIARTRGMATFMHRLDPLLPRGATLYAFFPADPGMRFYAPRPVMPWTGRPSGQPLYLLAWENEVPGPERTGGRPLERLAESEASHGRRGRLVLLRVPAGVLDRATRESRQNG